MTHLPTGEHALATYGDALRTAERSHERRPRLLTLSWLLGAEAVDSPGLLIGILAGRRRSLFRGADSGVRPKQRVDRPLG